MKYIPLTKGYIAIVDNEDYEALNKFKWYAHKSLNTHYACRKRRKDELGSAWKKNVHVSMHREIMKVSKNMDIDHIDHNGLNCQKSNMRIVNHMQNMWNIPRRKTSKTGYKGVSWDTQTSKWRAVITVNHKFISLGRFKELEDAIQSRKVAEKHYFGNYLNNN